MEKIIINKEGSLKPCPFCGGKETAYMAYEHHPEAIRWKIVCTNCMAGIDPGTIQDRWRLDDLWNQRDGDKNELFDEQICRVCGCTWNNACADGCYWVEEDLCSECVDKEDETNAKQN